MAVVDWCSFPAFGPSSLNGYRYGSGASGLPDNEPRQPCTPASSILRRRLDFAGDDETMSKGHRSGCDPDRGLSSPMSEIHGSHSECGISEDTDETEYQVVRYSETEEDNSSCLSEQSSHSGRIEKERVKQICREWMKSGARRSSPRILNLNSHSGTHWLGENEFERGSVVRDWVQMSAQQRKIRESLRDRDAEVSSQINARNESVIGAKRPFNRICGRQTLLDLLLRAQHEKKEELKALLKQKPVSGFPHRNRIQALLKGRFLRNGRSIPEKKPSSTAAMELGLLRQRRPVSGIRQEIFSKSDNSCTLNNIIESDSSSGDGHISESESTCKEQGIAWTPTTSDAENTSAESRSRRKFTAQVRDTEELVLSHHEGNAQDSSSGILGSRQEVSHDKSSCVGLEKILDIEANPRRIPDNGEEMKFDITRECSSATKDMNYSGQHEHYEFSGMNHLTESESNLNEEADSICSSAQYNELQESVTGTVGAEQDQMLESSEEWPSQVWPSMEVGETSRSPRTFYHHDEDNARSIELNGLSSRRRVSTLLQSDFHESLDQVLRSHMRRHSLISGDRELDYTSPSLSIVEQSGRDENESQDSALSETDERYPFATLSHSFWDVDLPPNFSNQHFSSECDAIDELRVDMARLHERMNNMQYMLEHCMDMQIGLQNSIRQEVCAALNRPTAPKEESTTNTSHESKWNSIRRGICCLCSDNNIESLLFRCGHMCTCSKCAEDLVHHTGKCPMCEAPVLEAVHVH